MADKRIYCGNGRQIHTTGGTFRSVSICLDDIPEEHITKSGKNGKRYVKLNISDMESKNAYGNDIYVTVDTWKPDPNYKKNETKPEPQTEGAADSSLIDELPFN
jgi:hypothetical protein